VKKTVKNNKASDAIKKDVKIPYVKRWGNQFTQAFNDEYIERLADELWDWYQEKENFWLKDFATSKMLHRQRISEFAQRNAYFKWIYELCSDMQESKTLRLGLNRKFNPAIPVLMLKNNHKWTDQPQNNFEEKGLPEFANKSDEELNEMIDQMRGEK
jgi:hypothetical protein